MLPEKLPISFTIIPGKYICQEMNEYREKFGKGQQQYLSFEDLLIDLVKMHFLEACRHMMPLLETIQISIIMVRLDIKNPPGDRLAAYSTGLSDAANGIYLFTAKSALIRDYLASYFDLSIPLNPDCTYTWEHELIHMLDHDYISELNYNLERPDMTEVLVDFILSFRSEGMAEIFYFMKNHSKYRSIQAARTQFLKRLDFLGDRPWDNPRFARVMYDVMSYEHRYYTIGTWMVLHVLGSEAYPKSTPEAAVVAEKIRKRVEMTNEEILSIVRQALEIDNRSFITGLTGPGPDGKPFVKHEDLEDLARYIELCKADMERNWSQPAQLRGDPKIVALFRLLRPRPR